MSAARKLEAVPDPFVGLSEQGEQQHRAGLVWADPSTVDAYVAKASDETLECRAAGHDFPLSRTSFQLSGYNPETGLFSQKLRCRRCASAVRTVWWEAVKVGHGGRGGYRYQEVSAELSYEPNPETGEVYAAPAGMGRIRRRDLRGSIATHAFAHMTLVEVRRLATRSDPQ